MRNQLSVLRWVAMAVLMVAACKEDPTSSLLSGFSRLELEFSYREVIIADSVLTYVLERDDQGNPLPPTATVATGCTGGVASVSPASAAPQLRTAFYVRGLTYGLTCVVATAGGRVDTMRIATYPKGVRVTGQDTVVSGLTGQYSHMYFDARQQNLPTGIPAPTWASTVPGIGAVDAAGLVSAFDPGVTTVSATGPGSPNITTAPACSGCVRGTKVVFVDPRPFTGTVGGAISGGLPGDTVLFAVGGTARKFNLATNADSMRVTFNFTFSPTFVARKTADSLYAVIPPTGKAGPLDLVIARRDSGRIAEKVTYTSPSEDLYDGYDRADSLGPGAGFTITANGDYFVTQSGLCIATPLGGVPGAAAADCDDFIRVQNSDVNPDTISVNVRWIPNVADIDAYPTSSCSVPLCDAATDSIFSFAAATGANPEAFSMILPANGTRYIWLNTFDNHGAAGTLVRVRITGKR